MQINSIAQYLPNYSNISSKEAINRDFVNVFNDLKINKDSISNLSEEMNIIVNTGELSFSKENWSRNDFPVWELFDDNVDIEKLSKWKPTALDPPMGDFSLQKNLNTIDSGQISIVMPDSVYQKMQNDEQYEKNIIENIKQWKKNYDLRDNAIAASYGANIGVYQAGKSYCILLDEQGNVNNNIVISNSITVNKSNGENYAYRDEKKIINGKKIEEPQKYVTKNDNIKEDSLSINDAFLEMGVVATSIIKKNKKNV